MTDLIPNDLSHLSDEQFRALCPLGEHVPGPEPLSPAAQVVMDAAFGRWMEIDDIDDDIPGEIAAAALRAAADQVVPEHPMVVPGGRSYESAWSATVQEDIRKKFLAIAAELEDQ